MQKNDKLLGELVFVSHACLSPLRGWLIVTNMQTYHRRLSSSLSNLTKYISLPTCMDPFSRLHSRSMSASVTSIFNGGADEIDWIAWEIPLDVVLVVLWCNIIIENTLKQAKAITIFGVRVATMIDRVGGGVLMRRKGEIWRALDIQGTMTNRRVM